MGFQRPAIDLARLGLGERFVEVARLPQQRAGVRTASAGPTCSSVAGVLLVREQVTPRERDVLAG
ncbi:hypothetical protein GCM10022226_08510 [Sphaerisporangium flaviroseum]|uniref:Uncharacterized protein n=1 Tax=Sphaerisporangium flaviroseum TaxID=509199 RepID=A0ABP7HDM7_9ACTN